MHPLKSFSKLLWLLLFFHLSAEANFKNNSIRLQKAYPDFISAVTENYLLWRDGIQMAIQTDMPNKTLAEKISHPTLFDQLNNMNYVAGKPKQVPAFGDDQGRIRYEPFFKKMYGQTEQEVKKNLVMMEWMPNTFNHRYQFRVTRINHVDQHLKKISDELEKLVQKNPAMKKFLEPNGTFNWRRIAATDRLSPHSFGFAIDLNTRYSNYWEWDLTKKHLPISEDAVVTYQNQIPWEIVEIFEKNNFIWGGKWYHYDTMHFEYRPEMFTLNILFLNYNNRS